MAGTLYIVATPIGNLQDITLRAIEILKNVDMIACEDTRQTIKLLNHFNIKKKTVSYHKYNEKQKSDNLIKYLLSGFNIALVSDAGTPIVSDPGETIVSKAMENNIKIIPIPGVSAITTAISVCCLDLKKFVFEGFLPSKKTEKNKMLSELKNEKRAIIIYEAPHKMGETLKCILEILGDRKIFIGREMTKLHEEYRITTVTKEIEKLSKLEPKGEFVLIIEGNSRDTNITEITDKEIEKELIKLLKSGKTKKESCAIIAEKTGISKNKIYKLSLSINVKQ